MSKIVNLGGGFVDLAEALELAHAGAGVTVLEVHLCPAILGLGRRISTRGVQNIFGRS